MGTGLLHEAAQWALLMCPMLLSQPACALTATLKLHLNGVFSKDFFNLCTLVFCLGVCMSACSITYNWSYREL